MAHLKEYIYPAEFVVIYSNYIDPAEIAKSSFSGLLSNMAPPIVIISQELTGTKISVSFILLMCLLRNSVCGHWSSQWVF